MQDLRYTAVLTRVVLQDTTTPRRTIALQIGAVALACVTVLGALTAGLASSGRAQAPQEQAQGH